MSTIRPSANISPCNLIASKSNILLKTSYHFFIIIFLILSFILFSFNLFCSVDFYIVIVLYFVGSEEEFILHVLQKTSLYFSYQFAGTSFFCRQSVFKMIINDLLFNVLFNSICHIRMIEG